jgi:hypothetical protein
MPGHVLRWLIPLALLNGLIFVFLVRPWQHYDEPSHFEFAALIAYHGRVPTAQTVDPHLRREIAVSMYRHNFYSPGVIPDLFATVPAPVGFDQTVHPPLYYALAALPIRSTRYLPIEVQLYAARLLSLGLYVFAVIIAWRITTIVTPDEPVVHIALPLILIATPTYADLMTAVNNDVLVSFAALGALLAMAHLLRSGVRPVALLLLGLALLVAIMTKRTALVLVPVALLALFWSGRRSAFRTRQRILLTGGLIGGSVLLGMAGLHVTRTVDGGVVIAPRQWLQAIDTAYLRLGINRWFEANAVWSLTGDQLNALLNIAFTSFWLRFGWAHLSLGPLADRAMWLLAFACMAGLALRAYQNRGLLSIWERRWIWLLFGCLILGWLSLAVRFELNLGNGAPGNYVPRGRYIFTTMLPHIWLLALGWQGLMPPSWRRFSLFGLLAIFSAGTVATWTMMYSYFWR